MNNKWYSKKLNLLNYMICAKQYKFYYIVEEWYKFILLLRSHIKYKEKYEKRENQKILGQNYDSLVSNSIKANVNKQIKLDFDMSYPCTTYRRLKYSFSDYLWDVK